MTTLKSDFQTEVLQSDLPVLVDFSAAWCGPCRMIEPAIKQLSQDFAGKAKVVTVDVDEHAEVAARYGIMSIPALVVFKAGKEVDRIVGAVPKAYIEEMVRRHV
jgi:thioredoxin 1